MKRKALFAGLVIDENDQPVNVVQVGEEDCYVVDDAGFLRHIPSEVVDKQVLQAIQATIDGNEEMISEQTAKFLGQDDIFSKALIESQLRNIDQQFEALMQTGIPEESRAYMGMVGMRIRINLHGEVIAIDQPGMIDPDSE
ncbi:MAG: hypothetical protein MUE67_07730 [Anaerolineales bacterium]|jgi:hypothetical protein|nr:hypothetical protein [Anaerolineales bacterium]